MVISRSNEGSLQIPLLLLTLVLVFAGMGVFGLLRNWRFLVETQLRLNQCVGGVALDFKDRLNSLSSSNARIGELRGAILLAELQPELIPPLQAALKAVVLYQEQVLLLWNAKRAKWELNRGCGVRGDSAFSLPRLNYQREPPDFLGPQPLKWVGQMPEEFRFEARNQSRTASAKVGRFSHDTDWSHLADTKSNSSFHSSWTAIWSIPASVGGKLSRSVSHTGSSSY